MKKDFTTDKLGMYGDPEGNFVITSGSNVSRTPITTKYLQDQIIATTADGTTKMLPPGVDNIDLPSNTVLEMKYQMGAQVDDQQQQLMQLISAYCQVVGGGDNSCAEKVAQSLQKNPEQMIQQMTATIQQAQQEQGMQEEESDEEDMMEEGGCIDCQEQFPQAQNLNWFYKAQGGEAFPQANTYPESWASYSGNQYAGGGEAFPQANVYPHMYFDGGITEAFPQAQTYLPYDRPGETRLNGMFQKGGTLYDYVKSIGIDPSYQSRKKLFSRFFDEPYTGTAEQNIYLLNALKTGNISLAERPKLGSLGLPKSQSFFNQPESKPTKSASTKAASVKSAPAKSYVAPAKSYEVEVPGIITSKSDSPRMTSPLVGIPTAPVKRSVLPKADQAQKEADQRAIPQTGVIVDKRSGEAVVLGPAGATTFPVLTGRNVEGNINPYLPKDLTFEYMSTPTGYYMLGDRSARGGKMKKDEFAGNVGMWMNPIPAYDVPAPVANYVAMHGTYDPAVREPLYNAPAEQRNVSMGCVNCGPTDFQHMMGTLGGPDTLMVVDSKRPEDSRLFNQAKQQAEFRMDPRNNYSVVATEPRGYTTTGYEYGGQTLQDVYQMMKRGGLNYNPKKKKGKQETFEQYMMRMGGLPKHQAQNSQVGSPANLNAWQRFRYGVKDMFTPGDGASIRVKDMGPEAVFPNATWQNSISDTGYNRYDQLGLQKGNVPEGRYDLLGPQSAMNNNQKQSQQQQNTSNQQQQNISNQQQKQNSGFGPGSQYDLKVKQGRSSDPFRAYNKGRTLTNVFGSKFGALSSIANAIGSRLGAAAGVLGGGKSRFKMKSYGADGEMLEKLKAKGSAADIAAAGMFGNMFPQQQQKTSTQRFSVPQTGPNPNVIPYRMDQEDNPAIWGQQPRMRFFQPGGQGNTEFKYTFSDPTQPNAGAFAFSAGVADQLSINRMKELREQMMNRGAMATAPITTATKTQAGSPQGAVNAPSFVTPTVEASRATDAFIPQQLMYTQSGGSILDQFDEDEEIDLDDMTPDERDQFIKAIYAAGGSVEFL